MSDPIVTWTNANGTTGAAGLDVALAQYASLKSAWKPSADTVVKVKQLLDSVKFSADYAKTPCVLAAWLGGAHDLNDWNFAFTNHSGSAQAVCDCEPYFGPLYRGVGWYLDALAAIAPVSAKLIQSAGTATAKETAKAADTQVKEQVSKTIDKAADKAAEIASDAAAAVGTGLKFASFGLGSALVILAVVAFFVYAPKGANK